MAKDSRLIYLVAADNRRDAWRVFFDITQEDTEKYRTIRELREDFNLTALRIPFERSYVAFISGDEGRPGTIQFLPESALEIRYRMTKRQVAAMLAALFPKL